MGQNDRFMRFPPKVRSLRIGSGPLQQLECHAGVVKVQGQSREREEFAGTAGLVYVFPFYVSVSI